MLDPFVISSPAIPGLAISVLVALGLLFTLVLLFDARAAGPLDPRGAAGTACAG